MKKNFKFYLTAWVLLLGVFNVVAFVTPAWQTLEKYTPSFWIGYGFITLAFVGQLVCSLLVFKEKENKKQFYKISLFAASYIGLISSFVVGIIFMIIPILPYWIGAIICPLVLVFNIVSILKANVAVDLVSKIDKKIEQQTFFIEEMRNLSEDLFVRVYTDETKGICKKIRDAFKYSDPMSVDELADIENEILNHFELVKQAVKENNIELLVAEKDELLALIAERNSKCKKLK